jgi:hypothetical protein
MLFYMSPKQLTQSWGGGLDDKDLIISKLLRHNIEKYKTLFPHVYAAIRLRKYPLR